MRQAAIDLTLHPKQALVLQTEANEILYGGAAGGGKSHLVRALFILLCTEIPGFQAYLFRRHSNDLEKNHLEGPKGFHAMLAPWTSVGLAEIVKGQIRFWNGSKIWLCHCKDEDDIYQYQGAEMHSLAIDEATQFTEKMYRFLRSRLRVPGLAVPATWKARLPIALLTANPIGVGVEWVRRFFVDNCTPTTIRKMPVADGGMIRQFVPALLEDNPSMALDDPQYEAKLEGIGSPALVRAMRYGDWSAIEGAYFADFHKIIIKPFEIPAHWVRFRSYDHGFARPFSVGWWAVSSGDYEAFRPGELIRYREWYGCEEPNEGQRLSIGEICKGILAADAGDPIDYSVADPAIFAEDGGESIAESFRLGGVSFRRGDNKRIPGWQQMHNRMKGYDDRPMVWCFDTCVHSIRTIPFLVHDELRCEDLDTDGEDHAADEWRYGLNSRPWLRVVEHTPKTNPMSFYALAGIRPQ
jgi:hypothetical protein